MSHSQLEADLAFVRQAVEATQRAGRVDVVPLIVWGGLTVLAAGAAYLAPSTDSVWLWVVVIGSAWAYTGWRALRRREVSPPDVFAAKVLRSLWSAALGAMTLIGFAGYFSGAVDPSAITPIVATLLGAAALGTGTLMQERWVRALGLAWWGTALALFVLPESARLAVFGIAMLCWVVLPLVAVQRRAARE